VKIKEALEFASDILGSRLESLEEQSGDQREAIKQTDDAIRAIEKLREFLEE